MSSEESPGARLKGYIRTHWTRAMGGDVALARTAGIRRQTLQEWYAGSSVPRLTELQIVASAIGVRVTDLVAAWEGVIAPETQQTPPPKWAREMEDRLTALVLANRETVVQKLVEQTARIGLERALNEQPPAGPAPGKRAEMPTRAGRGPRR